MERILPEVTEYKGVPYVGCAATEPCGSDSYPGTITWVSKETVEHTYQDRKTGEKIIVQLPKRVRFTRCDHRGVQGHDNSFTENQKYVYFDDTETLHGYVEYSYRAKRKNYVRTGTPWRSSAAQGLYFGSRTYYRDPCF